MMQEVKRILEAIPHDKWVSAADISIETGIESHRIGALITKNLTNVYVELKPMKLSWRGAHLYRRLKYEGEGKRRRYVPQ